MGAQALGSITNCRVTGDNPEDFFVEGIHSVGGLVGSFIGESGVQRLVASMPLRR